MTIEILKKIRDALKKDMENAKKAGNKEAYENLKWNYEEVCREIHERWLYCMD